VTRIAHLDPIGGLAGDMVLAAHFTPLGAGLTATVTLGTNQMVMRSVLQRDRSGITRALFRSLGVE